MRSRHRYQESYCHNVAMMTILFDSDHETRRENRDGAAYYF